MGMGAAKTAKTPAQSTLESFDDEEALRRAHERGYTSNGYPLSFDAGQAFRDEQDRIEREHEEAA
jgi:hypothetical protein